MELEQSEKMRIDLNEVNLENVVSKINPDKDEIVQAYLESIDHKTLHAILIAYQHLESSFDIEKSIDFLKFKKNYKD